MPVLFLVKVEGVEMAGENGAALTGQNRNRREV